MAGMVELSDQECKTTMINMPKALMLKPAGFGTNGLCRQRDGNPMKEQERNARDKSHGDTHAECFNGLIS